MASTRRYEEAYLFRVIDADTPIVLVPLEPRDFGLWVEMKVRVRDLHVPERWTKEGKAVNAAVHARLLKRWTPLVVETTGAKSFDRHVGDVWLPERGVSYRQAVLEIMEELGIGEGGMLPSPV